MYFTIAPCTAPVQLALRRQTKKLAHEHFTSHTSTSNFFVRLCLLACVLFPNFLLLSPFCGFCLSPFFLFFIFGRSHFHRSLPSVVHFFPSFDISLFPPYIHFLLLFCLDISISFISFFFVFSFIVSFVLRIAFF